MRKEEEERRKTSFLHGLNLEKEGLIETN